MGILDDAIREHLDLKRRLGAEAAEIQRLEDEAFGPPSRPGEPDFPETGESPAALAEAPPEPQLEESLPEEPQTFFNHETEPAPDPVSEAPAAAPIEADDPAAHLEVLSEPPPAPEPATGEPPIESLDTVEHHFEGAIEETGEAEAAPAEPAETEEGAPHTDEHPAEEGEEDVLEETPEFLRDQPEDDELWFEQGEPKDFDF
jgi:hypothetical protein